MKRKNKNTRRRRKDSFKVEDWLGDHFMLTIVLMVVFSMVAGGIISFGLTARYYEEQLDEAATQYRKVWNERNQYYESYVEMVNNTGNGG